MTLSALCGGKPRFQKDRIHIREKLYVSFAPHHRHALALEGDLTARARNIRGCRDSLDQCPCRRFLLRVADADIRRKDAFRGDAVLCTAAADQPAVARHAPFLVLQLFQLEDLMRRLRDRADALIAFACVNRLAVYAEFILEDPLPCKAEVSADMPLAVEERRAVLRLFANVSDRALFAEPTAVFLVTLEEEHQGAVGEAALFQCRHCEKRRDRTALAIDRTGAVEPSALDPCRG